MRIDELLKNINDRFGTKILKSYRKNDKRAYVDIYPKDIVEVARYMFKDMALRFNIASAVDDFDSIEILYHFSEDASMAFSSSTGSILMPFSCSRFLMSR